MEKLGYPVTRQAGSHLRLSHLDKPVHHLPIPRYKALRVRTLNLIIYDIADHLKAGKEEVLEQPVDS
ncbi:type II toxin-antitoxin system HicA family toxin [Candidatus Bipolaricaulota bacterium]|nr:type II toxin-antitoxin system HicA family toxin [Candidatus Bipolaricaulota bacterium]